MRSVAVFGSLLLFPICSSAAEPEFRTPYVWRVVVQTPLHPSLGAPARERLVKDLKAALQPVVGDELGRLEVVDLRSTPEKNWDPLWKKFTESGWPALDADEARKLTGIKTHFVKVELREGKIFHVEARQLDGSTGLLSAMVRSAETPHADNLARITGLMLAKDFGAVGIVESIPGDEKQVSVKFRGGQLSGFERAVQTGDVLAFSLVLEAKQSSVTKTAPDQYGKPQTGTCLRIISKLSNGECRCEILTRSTQPLLTAKNIVGYRAMKVATQEGPLRVKLVDPDGKAPPSTTSLEIWATDTGFTGKPTNRDTLDLQKGIYSSGRPLKNVACVVVRVGASKTEPFVVPLIPGDEPITLRVVIKQADIDKAEFEQACERLRTRVADAGMSQIELAKGLGKLITDGKYEDALTRAANGVKATDTADQILSEELAKLKKSPLVKENYPTTLLAVSEEQLKIVRSGKPELEKRMDELKLAIAKSNDPVKFEKEFRANELIRQIQYHVGRGEVPEAESLYDQVIELTKQEELKTKKTKLLEEWTAKTDEHKAARAFLLDQWRKATVLAEFQPLLPKLQPTADTLAKLGDKLGLRNLHSSIGIAYSRLQEQLAPLDENTDADRMVIKDLKAFADALRKVEQAAEAELLKLEPKK